MAKSTKKILRERAIRYGDYLGSATISENLATAANQAIKDNKTQLAPDQRGALQMIFVKIGRMLNGDPNYIDNWQDIAGYATLIADRLEADSIRTKSNVQERELGDFSL